MRSKDSVEKREFSFVALVFLACLVALITISLAFYLDSSKPGKVISVSTLIESDYQMESAIIMQTQKYKQNPNNAELKVYKKEIMPNIFMIVNCTENQNDGYVFEATVTGNQYFYRKIKAKSSKEISDKLIFLEN